MSLWNTIMKALNEKASQLVYASIPEPGAKPLEADAGYFRISLVDMFLADSRKWGTEWHPAVQAEVSVAREGVTPETMTRIASAPKEALARGALKQFHVTPLVPFRGGVVTVQASLLALKGASYLGVALQIVDAISKIAGPAVGPYAAVAREVVEGVEQLFDSANGEVHLGLHDELTSAGPTATNPLAAGYRVVVLGDAKKLDAKRLSVVDRTLRYAPKEGASPAPLTDHDYMLFYIETRSERDDWQIPSIEEPLLKARKALLSGDKLAAEVYERSAKTEAWTTPLLVEVDRTRVIKSITALLDKVRDPGHGLSPDASVDLAEAMKSAPAMAQAKALRYRSLAEALG